MTVSKSKKFWVDHIKRHQLSGLSQIEYCRQNQLNKSSFSAQKFQFKKQMNIPQVTSHEMIPVMSMRKTEFSMRINGVELNFPDIPTPEWMASFINNLEKTYAVHSSV